MKTKHEFRMNHKSFMAECMFCNKSYIQLRHEIEFYINDFAMMESMIANKIINLINKHTNCLTEDERIIKGIIE